MADYRLVYTSLKTGALLGELPALSVSFSDKMNSPGSLSATLLLEDTIDIEIPDGVGGVTDFTTPQGLSMTTMIPGATGIFLERDGIILWGGILWTLRFSVSSSTATISAEGFMSYLRRLHIEKNLSYSSTDQGAIAKDLLEEAMAKGGADIGLTAPTPTTSISRDRTYPAIERKSFGSAIEQLANVNDGFVWRFEHSWNSSQDGVDTTMELDVTALGRLTSYVFELGVNMSLLNLSLDGTSMANSAEAWGQADPQGQGFFRDSFDSAAIVNVPLLEKIHRASDVKVASTLQSMADDIVTRGADPLKRVTIEVFADSVPKLGSYEVGDRVQVRGTYGALSISGTWRILSLDLSVDTNSLERITLELVPQEVF